jgi:hypothetical protein
LSRPSRGWRVFLLINGLDIQIISPDGSQVRKLTLDPAKDYQPLARGLGIKIKWPGTDADGGVLRRGGSPSMSSVGRLGSSSCMAAVSIFASGIWAM